MTIFPFIFIRPECETPSLIRHETIHGWQQIEMLWLPFFVWYGVEYLLRRIKHDHATAYRNISFEREAYAGQYTPKRKPYGWIKYLRK